MFTSIFFFELKQGFKKLSTYIFFGIFLILYMLWGMALAGVLPLASGDSNIWVNSASSIAGSLVGLNQSIFGLVNSVILVAVISTAIQKDYEYNTHALFYTKPIKKSAYFFGRFFGAYTIALFVFFAQILGYYLGCVFGLGNSAVGPMNLMNFFEPFLLFSMPNILLLGIIFFALTTYTRSSMSAYLFSIILLVIRSITDAITSDISNKDLAAVLEPFGQEAFQRITEYWTPEEQNNYLIPLEGVLLYNRVLWVGLALIITMVSYYRFSFSQFLTPFTLFKRKVKESLSPSSVHLQNLADLPAVNRDFSTKASWRQLFYLSFFEFKKMSKSVFFVIICALASAMMFVIARFTGAIFGTETYPVTYQILEVVAGLAQLFILILIVFFSGTIIWRDRDHKVDELIGTTPVNNLVLFFSKYLGLIYITAALIGVVIISGIVIQLSHGYTNVEPLHYIKELFGFRLVHMIIVIGICLAVQVFSPNKYLGFFLALLPVRILSLLWGILEWENKLYLINSSGPGLPYSDMNGYGHQVYTFVLYKVYWLAIVLLVVFFSVRFYARGKEKSLKARFRLSRFSNRGVIRVGMILSLLVALATGSFIYYNVAILNKIISPTDQEKLQAEFEKKYKKYKRTLQPRVVESNVKVNIFPGERSMDANGFFYLKNKHKAPVDTLVINYDTDFKYSRLTIDNGFTSIVNDTVIGVKVWRLNKPIAPGDSVKLEFALSQSPKGFENSTPKTEVVYNGTFFNSSVFPTIGYNEDIELSQNKARKKYGLKPKPRMADVNDSLARMNTYISNDADWIRFETVVSTSGDQIAIAPGYLQKEWKGNGRNFYHYKMDSPILNFYSFLSARYEVKKDKWNNPADPSKPVAIEIYYHKGHEYNIDRMVKGIKRSLDYYTKNFSPYQHRQVRILEFPRYATFAQSFPNTIPFSEGIGFIAKVDEKSDKIDYPFYVTAHEVAHQWWAHQVIGGNVQGGTLMSETMSQYSALMVMEQEYGKEAMKKFLEYEMNTYLIGRATERKKELPLMLVENQQYIHYNKGSVVMYALKDYIGEDTLNAALRKYIKAVAYQEPPYTNSMEFVNYLKAATPDSLKYMITDMFETITVYENYIKDLSYTQRKDGKYDVKLTLGSVKFKVDSLGKQKKVPVSDYVDVGIFGEKLENGKTKEKELLLKKVKMDKDVKSFEFVVDEKPVKAGIDPYVKLIDRKPGNNTWNFGSKPPKVSTAAGNDNLMLMLGGGEEE